MLDEGGAQACWAWAGHEVVKTQSRRREEGLWMFVSKADRSCLILLLLCFNTCAIFKVDTRVK